MIANSSTPSVFTYLRREQKSTTGIDLLTQELHFLVMTIVVKV